MSNKIPAHLDHHEWPWPLYMGSKDKPGPGVFYNSWIRIIMSNVMHLENPENPNGLKWFPVEAIKLVLPTEIALRDEPDRSAAQQLAAMVPDMHPTIRDALLHGLYREKPVYAIGHEKKGEELKCLFNLKAAPSMHRVLNVPLTTPVRTIPRAQLEAAATPREIGNAQYLEVWGDGFFVNGVHRIGRRTPSNPTLRSVPRSLLVGKMPNKPKLSASGEYYVVDPERLGWVCLISATEDGPKVDAVMVLRKAMNHFECTSRVMLEKSGVNLAKEKRLTCYQDVLAEMWNPYEPEETKERNPFALNDQRRSRYGAVRSAARTSESPRRQRRRSGGKK